MGTCPRESKPGILVRRSPQLVDHLCTDATIVLFVAPMQLRKRQETTRFYIAKTLFKGEIPILVRGIPGFQFAMSHGPPRKMQAVEHRLVRGR